MKFLTGFEQIPNTLIEHGEQPERGCAALDKIPAECSEWSVCWEIAHRLAEGTDLVDCCDDIMHYGLSPFLAGEGDGKEAGLHGEILKGNF